MELVSKAQPVRQEARAHLEQPVSRVLQVKQAQLALQELQDLQDHLAAPEALGVLEFPVPQATPEALGLRVLVDQLVKRVQRV